MAQIFMTFIGTGNYEPVTYTLGEQSFKNRFVSKSLLQMLTEQGKQFDRLIFFLTEQARKLNWEKYIRKGKDGKEVEDEGLLPFLEEHFPGKFTPVAIPDGNNEQEDHGAVPEGLRFD